VEPARDLDKTRALDHKTIRGGLVDRKALAVPTHGQDILDLSSRQVTAAKRFLLHSAPRAPDFACVQTRDHAENVAALSDRLDFEIGHGIPTPDSSLSSHGKPLSGLGVLLGCCGSGARRLLRLLAYCSPATRRQLRLLGCCRSGARGCPACSGSAARRHRAGLDALQTPLLNLDPLDAVQITAHKRLEMPPEGLAHCCVDILRRNLVDQGKSVSECHKLGLRAASKLSLDHPTVIQPVIRKAIQLL
jgi:hypothetical protein